MCLKGISSIVAELLILIIVITLAVTAYSVTIGAIFGQTSKLIEVADATCDTTSAIYYVVVRNTDTIEAVKTSEVLAFLDDQKSDLIWSGGPGYYIEENFDGPAGFVNWNNFIDNGFGRWYVTGAGTPPPGGGAGGSPNYAQFDYSSPSFPQAALESPVIDFDSGENDRLEFYYFLQEVEGVGLHLQEETSPNNWYTIWTPPVTNPTTWYQETIDLSALNGKKRLRFLADATLGSGKFSIDQVVVRSDAFSTVSSIPPGESEIAIVKPSVVSSGTHKIKIVGPAGRAEQLPVRCN